MSKFATAIAFVLGLGCGSFGTYIFVKKKYEQIAQEEIDSVKKAYKEKNLIYCHVDTNIPSNDEENDFKRVIHHEEFWEKKNPYLNDDVKDFLTPPKDLISEYDRESPYVISPEEFASNDDYEKISYTYYNMDGIVADEMNAEVTDYEDRIGEDSLSHFGEYEDDSVYVRNDVLKCDYEILMDNSSYYPIPGTSERHNNEEIEDE